MTCGWLSGPLKAFLEGEPGRIRVPVPVYLVDHPRGKLLFDTGLHVDTQVDPAGRIGAAADVYEVDFSPGEEVASRLATLDIDVGEIRFVVNSHLHFDHAGGNAQIPDATLIVQRREWRAGRDPDQARANHFDRRDYDLGHDVREVDGEFDVFGDGSVVCLPAFGHTPGHQALRIRLEAGDVVLAADACYLRRTLEDLHLPPFGHDRGAMLETLRTLRRLRERGARIFYGHDPGFWAGVPQAPADIF